MSDLMVGAPRFELGTPSPPDWCANRAALRSDEEKPLNIGPFCLYRVRPQNSIAENKGRKVPKSVHRIPKNPRSPFTLCAMDPPFPTSDFIEAAGVPSHARQRSNCSRLPHQAVPESVCLRTARIGSAELMRSKKLWISKSSTHA